MIHLSVALIVVAFVAADFGSDMWLSGDTAKGWDWSLTIVLLYALWWFWWHREDK